MDKPQRRKLTRALKSQRNNLREIMYLLHGDVDETGKPLYSSLALARRMEEAIALLGHVIASLEDAP